jgi:hypothetical protein
MGTWVPLFYDYTVELGLISEEWKVGNIYRIKNDIKSEGV